MIDSFLLNKPTPTIGAPPTVTPGDPNALPLVWPVVVVPPIGVEPKPPLVPVPGSVPPVVEVEEEVEVDDPLFPKPDPEFPPNGDVLDPPNAEPPLLPSEELPPPNDEPEVEDPNGEEDAPVVAPVCVIPFDCIDWPNKPTGATFASPR